MIRQIWKVRNTASGQAEPSPTATQEAAAAVLANPNDESETTITGAAKEAEQSVADDGAKRPKDRKALLVDAPSDSSLSVCTYDPHSGTVYALVEPSAGKAAKNGDSAALDEESKETAPPTTKAQPPGLLQMPAALTIARDGAGAGQGPELVDGAAGSQPAASSNAPSDFSPLQTLNTAVAEHDPFARAKTGAAAESSNKSALVSTPNCLRFSPTLSSANVVITNNGKCASSLASVRRSLIFPCRVWGGKILPVPSVSVTRVSSSQSQHK